MRSTLIFICLCFAVVNFAQSQEIPTVFPASPEASTLGKYGEIPVNLSTGNINYTIPVYTIKEHGFSLPVSLSYSYSGLLIEEVPGITGLGWKLNAGGLITRQVRGRPDDDPHGYIGQHMVGQNSVIPYLNGTLTQEQEDLFLDLVYYGSRDSQPDKFMLNIGGVSASFYFDENKNPVILPYKPYKIEIIGDDLANGLKVTDDTGIQYFFEETETSKRIEYTAISDALATSPNGYISSWKVSKIVLVNGQEINFSYAPYQYKTRIFYESYQEINPFGSTNNCTGSVFPDVSSAKYELDTKILQQITFPKGSINFTTQSDIPTEFNQYLAVLEGIDISDNNGAQVSSVDLSYDSTTKTRKLLTEVTVNNNPENTYGFEYYGTLADNLHYSKQDAWGYYNSNNSNYLIDPNNITANRFPDATKSVSGALQKVQHPTKGTTEFEYEANTYDPGEGAISVDDFLSCENAPFNKTYSVGGGLGHWSGAYTMNDVKTFEITDDTKFVSIDLHVLKSNPFGNVEAGVRMISGTPNGTSCYTADCDPSETCTGFSILYGGGFAAEPLENNQSVKVRLAVGTYEVYAEASSAFIEEYKSLEAWASVSVWDETLAEPGQSFRARETGGIRIAKITSCPDDSGQGCITKKYTYENEEGISEGFLFKRRDLFSYTTVHYGWPTITQYSYCNKIVYSSSSNVPLGKFSGSHIIYKKVIEEKENDLGETTGSRIVSFNVQPGVPVEVYPFAPLDEKEWRNGLVQMEQVKDNIGTLLRKTENNYQFSTALNLSGGTIARGFKTGRQMFFYLTNGGLVFSPDYLVISPTTFDAGEDVTWLSSTTETFFDENGRQVVSNSDYTYTNPHGHIKEQTTTKGNGISAKKRNVYPYEVATPEADALTTLNRLAAALEEETFKIDAFGNETPVSTLKTIYQDFSGILLPQTIQEATGTETLENKINYHSYDTFSNPLHISRENGSPISYIWGYHNTLPIVMLEGIAWSDINPADIISLKLLSDNDQDAVSEQSLRDAFNTLRLNYPDAVFTGYTYDPLIGVTSSVDSRGYVSFYNYDSFNRLVNIKDANGNIIEEFGYNYAQEAAQYDPLIIAIDYGTDDTDYQWFTANVSGGSGDYNYAWFESIGDSSVNFEANASGTADTYQLMVDCSTTKYVKLVVTDNITGETVEQTKVNNNECPYPALTVNVTYGTHSDTHQNFVSMVNGGSGNVTYTWYKGVGTSSFAFEVTPAGIQPNYSLNISCTTYKWVKLVVTDTVTGESVVKVTKSNNSPCSGGGGGDPIGPDPFDPEQ